MIQFGCRIQNNIHKFIIFLYTNNEVAKKKKEKEMKKAISFSTAPKRIQCLGINVTKELEVQ